jgi:hypothetical protein
MSFELHDQVKQYTYNIVGEYYNNLTMTKMKDAEGYSMYYAKIKSMLMSKHRYIIATVIQENNIPGTNVPLTQLAWISLQAREIEDDYNLPPQQYEPSDLAKSNFKLINLIKSKTQITDTSTTFTIENGQLPIEIVMLHSKNNTNYPPRFPISMALREFTSIIIFTQG